MTKSHSLSFTAVALLSLNIGLASAEAAPETPQVKPDTQTQPEKPSSPKEETADKKAPPSDTTKVTKASAEPDCE